MCPRSFKGLSRDRSISVQVYKNILNVSILILKII